MNHKTYLFSIFLAVLFLTGCQKPLEISNTTLSQNDLSICKEATCPEVNVSYIQVVGDRGVSKKINDSIEHFIIQSLIIDKDIVKQPKRIKDAMDDFIEMYRLHSAEFPEMSAAYFAEISVTDSFRSDDLLSLACSTYLYTGGAHGYGTLQFKNFDPTTGELLQLEAIFNDVSAFEKLAEEAFKQQNDIASSENINATGFWFEEDSFSLPATLGFSEKGVVLHYNAYDIAPYSTGAIEVAISMETIKPLLKISVDH
jgi:hypothetical protein